MKLYYYKDPNFGDALNPFLWEQLVPGAFDDDERQLFVGTGTLLNNGLPKNAQKLVFGSGAGYGSGLPVPDERWTIYWVRGPLTARALGLPESAFISDGALLLRTLDLPPVSRSDKIAFMPHCRSLAFWDWKDTCARLGMEFIDPYAPVPQVLTCIRQAKVLVTEALHGAIAADAFRVPWVPVRAYRSVLASKWEDWCGSVGLTYKPVALPSLYSRASIAAKFSSARMRRLAQGASFPLGLVNPVLVLRLNSILRRLEQNPPAQQSDEKILARSIERMQKQLDRFRREYGV